MKPSALTKLLAHAFRRLLKVLIVSPPGLGKSALVDQAAAAVGADLIVMHPAVSDPTDFKGMPAVLKKGSDSVAEFLPFGNLRALVEATSLTICFIDDIGQAPHAVQAALMQLIHAREVDGQKISDHVVFVGATNDASHMAGVTSILEPVKSRWDTIIELTFDLPDWIAWGLDPKQGNIPPELIAFARFRPALMNDFKPTKELKNSPCPRTVEAVGKWIRAGVTDSAVIAGAAGEGYAVEFAAFHKVWRSLPDLDSILAAPGVAPVPDTSDPSLVIATATALSFKATPANFGSVLTYLARLPKEYEVFSVADALKRDPKLGSSQPYTQWALANVQHLA
jgi:MoxR-like ATPase